MPEENFQHAIKRRYLAKESRLETIQLLLTLPLSLITFSTHIRKSLSVNLPSKRCLTASFFSFSSCCHSQRSTFVYLWGFLRLGRLPQSTTVNRSTNPSPIFNCFTSVQITKGRHGIREIPELDEEPKQFQGRDGQEGRKKFGLTWAQCLRGALINPARMWAAIAGFRVQSANSYTTGPSVRDSNSGCLLQMVMPKDVYKIDRERGTSSRFNCRFVMCSAPVFLGCRSFRLLWEAQKRHQPQVHGAWVLATLTASSQGPGRNQKIQPQQRRGKNFGKRNFPGRSTIPFGSTLSACILRRKPSGQKQMDQYHSLHGPRKNEKGLIDADIPRNESSTFAHEKFGRLDIRIHYPKWKNLRVLQGTIAQKMCSHYLGLPKLEGIKVSLSTSLAPQS